MVFKFEVGLVVTLFPHGCCWFLVVKVFCGYCRLGLRGEALRLVFLCLPLCFGLD